MDDAIDDEGRLGMGVGWLVSKQPPWSIATSTSTAPGFIVANIARVTSLGAAAPGTSTAPMTRSALATQSAILARLAKRVLARASK